MCILAKLSRKINNLLWCQNSGQDHVRCSNNVLKGKYKIFLNSFNFQQDQWIRWKTKQNVIMISLWKLIIRNIQRNKTKKDGPSGGLFRYFFGNLQISSVFLFSSHHQIYKCFHSNLVENRLINFFSSLCWVSSSCVTS